MALGGLQKSRQTYIQVKWVTEEWWFILLWLWFGVSAMMITLSIRYNILHTWHCPYHCGGVLSPFAISILSLFVVCCVCCPLLGTKGIWWCNWARKTVRGRRV
eukprot:SAG11_NODE_4123_length_2054_cov_2.547315_2_plen_103_part_00